jgi:segregation and condensation protein A
VETDTKEHSYKVKTSLFEGPFGLLLGLIEERKLFINDLSLAEVTEDYLKYVNGMQTGDSISSSKYNTELSNFIVIAATLILIKSKSLLPNLNLTLDEEGDISSLEERLRLFELFNKLSLNIKEKFGKKIIFSPLERKSGAVVFLPDDQITRESMMQFAHEVLGRIPKKTILSEVEVKKVISIEEMIDRLTTKIQESLSMNFKDFAGAAVTREEKVVVIVSFLAMLELVRQGILSVAQENNFEDIMIEKFIPEETIEQEIEISIE